MAEWRQLKLLQTKATTAYNKMRQLGLSIIKVEEAWKLREE